MKRTLVVVAAVVGFAAAASAATLNVFTTNSSNVAQNTFNVGDTILLTVAMDAQGGTDNGIHGELFFNSAVAHALAGGSSQPGFFANAGVLGVGSGFAVGWDSNNGSAVPSAPLVPSGTAVMTLVVNNPGISAVYWGGTTLDFFNIYSYSQDGIHIDTGWTFDTCETCIPEPATAALIGMGLLGLAGWRRARVLRRA